MTYPSTCLYMFLRNAEQITGGVGKGMCVVWSADVNRGEVCAPCVWGAPMQCMCVRSIYPRTCDRAPFKRSMRCAKTGCEVRQLNAYPVQHRRLTQSLNDCK